MCIQCTCMMKAHVWGGVESSGWSPVARDAEKTMWWGGDGDGEIGGMMRWWCGEVVMGMMVKVVVMVMIVVIVGGSGVVRWW